MRFKDFIKSRPLVLEMAGKFENSKYQQIFDKITEEDIDFAGLNRAGAQKVLFYFALLNNKGNIKAAAESSGYSKAGFQDFYEKFFTDEQKDDVGPSGAEFASEKEKPVNEMARTALAVPPELEKKVVQIIELFKKNGIGKLLKDAGFQDLWFAILRAQQMRIVSHLIQTKGNPIGWQNQLKKDLYSDPSKDYDGADKGTKIRGSTARNDLSTMYLVTGETEMSDDKLDVGGWGSLTMLRSAKKDPKAMAALKKQYVISRVKGELDDVKAKELDADLDVKTRLAAAKAKLDALKDAGDSPDDDFWDSI